MPNMQPMQEQRNPNTMNIDELSTLEVIKKINDEDKKDLNLKFRGSSNQRIIDVPESLKVHKVIPYDV